MGLARMAAAGLAAGLWLGFGTALSGFAFAQDGARPAALECLWAGLDDEARSSVSASVRRYNDGLGTDPLTDGLAVRLGAGSTELAMATNPEALENCGLRGDPASQHLAMRALAMRANADNAKARLAALDGVPEAVDEAFARLAGFRREELADWVWSGSDESSELLGAFYRALERPRVNRTFEQRRIMGMGLMARLAEHRATTCLLGDAPAQAACLAAER